MLRNPTEWLIEALNGATIEGRVTPESVLRIPSMWYAINKICSHVGQLPIDLKRDLGEGRGSSTLRNDSRWKLLRTRPNGYQIPSVFKEQLTMQMLLHGDGRAFKAMQGSRVVELIPLSEYTSTVMILGEKVHITKIDKDSRLARYRQPDDLTTGKSILFDDEVVHLPNLTIDGAKGVKFYEMAADTIKSGRAADKRSVKSMEKGFTGKVMLEAPPGSFRDEKKAQEFYDQFRERHQADKDGEGVGLLREGIKANVLQMTNHDAQFIEQRRFMRQEAALWFLLESIVGDDSSVSYNSLEQKTLAYLQNCLNRWLKRWEEELDAKLLDEREQDTLYFKVNTRPLLRSDLVTTMTAINSAVRGRIMNPNEARDLLDMNPYEGGDIYENPAISTGQPGASDQEPRSAARAAVVNRLESLLNVEVRRVDTYLGQQNPMKKIEAFFQKWETTLGDAIEDMGGDRTLASQHCTESIEALLTGADKHTPVNTAEELADFILKGIE